MTTVEQTRSRDGLLWFLLAGSAAAFLMIGCTRPVRPDDMSAAAHRSEATKERLAAEEHRRQFDPYAVAAAPVGRGVESVSVASHENPTQHHLVVADAHDAHAREHESAAAELDAFEARECAGLGHAERAACPTLLGIRRVSDISGGVRIELASAEVTPAVIARMRCHLAFARTRGYERAPDCPLYVRGVEIRASSDGRAIEITGNTNALAGEIRARFNAR
jgi:hypothetical protein